MGAVIYNKMSFWGAPKENAGFFENPVFINLLEHLFFFRQQNRELSRLGKPLRRHFGVSGRKRRQRLFNPFEFFDHTTYDPIVAPAGIFPRHLQDQAFCFLIYFWAPYTSTPFRPI